jgi:hypothetical protein
MRIRIRNPIIRTFGINSLAGELRVLSSSCRLLSLSGDDFGGPDLAAADINGSSTKLLVRCFPAAAPRPFMRKRSTYTGYLSPKDLKALTEARGSAWIGVGRTWHCTTKNSVEDTGSGAFLTLDPGSGTGKKSGSGSGVNNPDHNS